MGMIEDILKALDRLPAWKRLGEIPPEVDALRKRVVALEEKLQDTWPPDVCKFCGKRAVRLAGTFGPINNKGQIEQNWECRECQQTEVRVVNP